MKRRKMSEGLRVSLMESMHNPAAAYNVALILEAEHRSPLNVQDYFFQSAHGGYTPAMIKIASLFFTGRFLEKSGENSEPQPVRNIDQGLMWLFRASNGGDETAFYLLARCYLDGIGVKQSTKTAYEYLDRVTFPDILPDFLANPYEGTEILVFGFASPKITQYLRQRRNLPIPPHTNVLSRMQQACGQVKNKNYRRIGF